MCHSIDSRSNRVLRSLDATLCLTADEVSLRSGIDKHNVVNVMGLLILRGLAARAEVGCYTLTIEGASFIAAGKIIKSGPHQCHTGPRKVKSDSYQKIWSALRIKGKASTAELEELVGDCSRDNILKYLKALRQAGYVRELPVRQAGTCETSNGFKRYALLVNNGPVAPQVRKHRTELFDPNTGKITMIGGVA